jgi:hypothetical protein
MESSALTSQGMGIIVLLSFHLPVETSVKLDKRVAPAIAGAALFALVLGYRCARPHHAIDGLDELDAAIRGRGSCPHFQIFEGNAPLPDSKKLALLGYAKSIIKGEIVKSDARSLTANAPPTLYLKVIDSGSKVPGYFVITAFEADDGGACDVRKFLEALWQYDQIGRYGRLQKDPAELYGAFSRACERDGSHLSSIGLGQITGPLGGNGSWEDVASEYQQIADANAARSKLRFR